MARLAVDDGGDGCGFARVDVGAGGVTRYVVFVVGFGDGEPCRKDPKHTRD